MERKPINTISLIETANALLADHKGLFAMDESTSTCNKRFAQLGISETAESRRLYRELIIKTKGLNESISGIIMYHETIHQSDEEGNPFIKIIADAGIIPGIKVDVGKEDLPGFPGEKITEGLDGLKYRLKQYARLGARFAKWRAVFFIGKDIPTVTCINSNAHAMARYAALCQECGLVPIVEPEVMMLGNHSAQQCYQVTRQVLKTVFDQLYLQNVALEGMILKPNMILSGLDSDEKKGAEQIADDTINCLLDSVPATVPGIVFLSGGQSPIEATERLNAMHFIKKDNLPWTLSFSFGRALQNPAMEIWAGKKENILSAQEAIYHRSNCNRAANMGLYNTEMEKQKILA